MKKKAARHNTGARPQPAQLEAIVRLAEAGKFSAARERLDSLRQQFPSFKPLLALAYELEVQDGSQVAAVMAAWDWTQSSPNSDGAWEALRDATGTAFPALFLFAVRHLETLRGNTPSPEPEEMPTPFGALRFDEARRMDLCRVLLSNSRFDEAAAALAGIGHIAARNNLALVEFARGRIAEALAQFEENWRQVPDNLFALERIVRLRLWTGGLATAADLAAPLLATRPQRWDDLRAKMVGLLLLDRFADADALFVESGEFPTPRERSEFCGLGAYAAWRLGELATANERLKQACDLDDENEAAREAADGLAFAKLTNDTPDWTIGDFAGWWPLSHIDTMRRSRPATEEAAARLMGSLSPHAQYLGRMAEQSGKGGRQLAVALLRTRAEKGDAAAIAELRSLLARPCGPDSQRSEIHGWLADKGLIAKGEVSRLRVGGELREVRAHSFRIVDTPTADNELPPADAKEYERMHGLAIAGKTAQAHEILTRLYEKYPDSPRILANLAAIRNGLLYPAAETEALARRAHAIDPDYLFARTHLAKILAARGDVEAATEILKPLAELEEMHTSEWRAYTLAQVDIAKARGDFPAVFRLMSTLRDMDKQFGR